MEYAYLSANAISLLVWAILFLLRPDLRRIMLIMSCFAMPLALFDLVFVPSYWQPVTLFDWPIGIEGFLYSFSVGGIAAVLYPTLSGRVPQHFRDWRQSAWRTPLVLAASLVAFVIALACGIPNPEYAAYIAIGTGITAILLLRRDLLPGMAISAAAFGAVYFITLKIWTLLFPGVESWFRFEHMPYFFVWGVPGWELLFGIGFGAFWSGLCCLVLGYTFWSRHRGS